MVGIKPQLALINTSISLVLDGTPFATKQLYDAPVYDIPTVNEDGAMGAYPGYVDSFGDNKSCAIDDSYCMQLYHRIQSATLNDTPAFGKVNDMIYETLTCKMVVFAKPSIILKNQEELYRMIVAGIPSMIDKASITAYDLDFMKVRPQGANFNATTLFGEEYKGISQRIGLPNGIYFSISYQIESRFKKDCFVECAV